MRSLLLTLLLASVATPALAAKDAELLAAGCAAIDARNHATAVDLLEKAVAANPKNARANHYLGVAYGNLALDANVLKQALLAKKAKAALERASALDPNYLEPRIALVDYYTIAPGFMGGSEVKAREQAAEIKKLDLLQGHRAFARIYMREKKMDLARNELVVAVRAQPSNPKSHQFLGNFYLNEKNFSAALHEFEMALKLDPNYLVTQYRIGQYSAKAEKDYARGEAAIRKYLTYKPAEDEPPLSAAWYWLGMIEEKQGKKIEAKRSFTTAAKLAPHDSVIKKALKRVS